MKITKSLIVFLLSTSFSLFSSGASTLELKVSAEADWTSTGIYLLEGQEINLDHTGGSWSMFENVYPIHGAEGWSNFPYENCVFGELIAKLVKYGEKPSDAEVICVGKNKKISVNYNAYLYLRANDSYMDDNVGVLNVRFKSQLGRFCKLSTQKIPHCRRLGSEPNCTRTVSGLKTCSSFPKKMSLYRRYLAEGLCCTNPTEDKTSFCKNYEVDYSDVLTYELALLSTFDSKHKKWITSNYENDCSGNNVVKEN
ncbi:MAG: hypothetical protein AB8E15_12840 [Bdellovibrionales bacterium]